MLGFCFSVSHGQTSLCAFSVYIMGKKSCPQRLQRKKNVLEPCWLATGPGCTTPLLNMSRNVPATPKGIQQFKNIDDRKKFPGPKKKTLTGQKCLASLNIY